MARYYLKLQDLASRMQTIDASLGDGDDAELDELIPKIEERLTTFEEEAEEEVEEEEEDDDDETIDQVSGD